MRTLVTVLLFALPGMAQSPLLPSPITTIAELPAMTTPLPAGSYIGSPNRAAVQGRVLYAWSVAALASANAADIASSWHQEEANPLLGRNTQFGFQSVAIKSGLTGATFAIEYFALRHRPDLRKRLAWMNFAASGVLGGVAAHNMSLRQ